MGIQLGGIVAFMPVFLARLGASSALLGWYNSAPSLFLMFLLIPGASVAERQVDQVRVRVKYARILRMAYLVCAVAPFVVPTEYLPIVLVVIWTLTTLPNAVAIPSWTAVLASAVSPRRRASVNSGRWALLGVVSALGTAAFGWTLDHVLYPYNYQLVFAVSFALSMLDPYAFSFIKVPPSEPVRSEKTGTLVERLLAYVRPAKQQPAFLRYLLITLPYRIALNLPVPLYSLFWVNELAAPDTVIGLRGTVGNCVLVVGYLLWGRWTRRLGHRTVLMLSAGLMALYPIATALSPTPAGLLPAAAIWGFGAAGVDIGLFDMMLGVCPTERQPLFAAIWMIVARFAMFLGPLLGASLADLTTLGTALLIGGFAQMATLLPLFALPKDC